MVKHLSEEQKNKVQFFAEAQYGFIVQWQDDTSSRYRHGFDFRWTRSYGLMDKWLSPRPFKAKLRVRFPLRLQVINIDKNCVICYNEYDVEQW